MKLFTGVILICKYWRLDAPQDFAPAEPYLISIEAAQLTSPDLMSQKYELTFWYLSEWDISCFRWNKNKSIEIKINLRFDLNKKQNRQNKSLWILSKIDSSLVAWQRKLHAPDWIHARTGSNATTYLRAEAGRYDKIVLDERICLLCSGNKIEHETHLLPDCQRYSFPKLKLKLMIFENYRMKLWYHQTDEL